VMLPIRLAMQRLKAGAVMGPLYQTLGQTRLPETGGQTSLLLIPSD